MQHVSSFHLLTLFLTVDRNLLAPNCTTYIPLTTTANTSSSSTTTTSSTTLKGYTPQRLARSFVLRLPHHDTDTPMRFHFHFHQQTLRRLASVKKPCSISLRVWGRKFPPAECFLVEDMNHVGLGAAAELVTATPSSTRDFVSGRARAKMRKEAWLRILASRGRECNGPSDAAQLAPEGLLASMTPNTSGTTLSAQTRCAAGVRPSI